MTYTKNQIIDGIVKYIKSDMIPAMPDPNIKIVLNIAAHYMSAKPAFVDKIFDNPIMEMLKEDDGRYDLDPQVISQAFGQDKFTITIPAIKFVNPTEKTLSFNAGDINKLSQYIGG